MRVMNGPANARRTAASIIFTVVALTVGVAAIKSYFETAAVEFTQTLQQPIVQVSLSALTVVLLVACFVIAIQYLPRRIA